MIAVQPSGFRVRAGLTLLACCAVPIAAAGLLYSNDFENMQYGTIHGQAGWTVGGDGSHGQVVYLGSTSALAVYAVVGWSEEVKSDYVAPSTLRYVVIETDFMTTGDSGTFWFMDNNSLPPHNPDAIFWRFNYSASNASPGIPVLPVQASEWHHVAIEVDQTIRKIVGVNYDGTWYTEIDNQPTDPSQLAFMVFRGHADNEQASMTPLYIDNLLIQDSDVRVSPANRRPGDLNCDSAVTVGDIGGFVLALTNPEGYQAAYPQCDPLSADTNFDGAVTVGDIGRFVEMLTAS